MFKHLQSWLLLLLLSLSLPNVVQAQQDDDKPVVTEIKITSKAESLPKVFKRIEKQTGYKFVFINKEIGRYTFEGKVNTSDIKEAMRIIIGDKPLTYTIDHQFINVSIKGREKGQASERKRVTGRITDENGAPVPGANIKLIGTRFGTVSDIDGNYVIRDVMYGDVMLVSFIGYKTESVTIKDKDKINVRLTPKENSLDEVAVVAFGQQKKESIVSAITTVRPAELKVSSPDLTTSFAGRIPGMIAWQTGGLPAAMSEDEMNTKFYIRGITSFQSGANTDPLILLDGVESSKLDLSRLQVEDIESFSVLKDASATAMYGARGANGVIMVTTKKGEEGSVYTTTRYEAHLSMPTRQIETVDGLDYMRYYNQALMGRSGGLASPQYSVERINRTASGRYPNWVYPNNDWYDILFNDYTINHEAGVSLRGGSSVMQYYASVNYVHEEGMLKSDQLNQFDCNISNNQVQFRTNLNINLAPSIKLVINSNTNLDRYHGPVSDQRKAYAYAFNASPVDFAPTYPADETHNWPHIRFGTTAGKATNPYMENQKGYKERTRISTTNKAEYIQNLSQWVKGLEVRASAAIVQANYYDNTFSTIPFKYRLASYDTETGKHTLEGVENQYSDKSLNAGTPTNNNDTRITYEARVYHSAAWGDHQTSLTGVAQMYERTHAENDGSSWGDESPVIEQMPQRNLTYSGRASYGFKDRYFGEFSLAYNGSERFAKQNQMGIFPAVGGAWVASSEPWMKPISKYLSYLKFRLSWGKVGNDGVIDTPRYVYLQSLALKGKGMFSRDVEAYSQGSMSRNIVNFYGDPDIQWEIAEQTNLGIETKLFGGIIELQADLYRELRHNILANRYVIPVTMGIEKAPLDNIGETDSRGVDLSGKVQYQWNNDAYVIFNATLTYNRVKYRAIEEAVNKPAYQRKVGKEISQAMGYIAEGLFRDQAEIDNSPRQDGNIMPGDIKYRDLNSDGVIDVNDATFIGYPETPRLIYGFSTFANYKRFEFNMSFQGSGKRTFFIDAEAISPFCSGTDFVGNRSMLKAIADSHWSEDNQEEMPFWPRLSVDNIINHSPQEDRDANAETRKSTYFMRECKFLRCTSLSLAYNLPKNWLKRMRLSTCKLTLSTNNLFLLSDFDLWDVELGEDGFNYPIQKTFTVGLNVNF